MAVKKKAVKKAIRKPATQVKAKKPAVKKAVKKVVPKTRKTKGRPEFKVTKAITNKIETLAARGLIIKQIAQSLGWGETTYFEKKKQFPEVGEAYERGKAKGIANVTGFLYKNCEKGDTQAQKYYLNNRDPNNWKDKRSHELGGIGGGAIQVEDKTKITAGMSLTEAAKAYAAEVLTKND